jgi:hypothetical protein
MDHSLDSATDATPSNPLILAQLVETHPLRIRWQDFITTTLASETAIQSTPLGGFHGSPLGADPLHSHHPGLDNDDDGGSPNLPPRGLLVGGDAIDMDDNDLDVAASMMAGLSMKRDGNESDMLSGLPNDSGVGNARGYMFDDPLGDGRFGKFDDDGNSSSDEESDNTGGSGGAANDGAAPPVMDLFAGNFDTTERGDQPKGKWSDFANFDDAFAGVGEDMPAADSPGSNGESANVFGNKEDHVGLLDAEPEPEPVPIRDDNGDDSSHSSEEEEPVKTEVPDKVAVDPAVGIVETADSS